MSIIKKSAWLLPCAGAIAVSLYPSKAPAIPYFARKYKTTCSRCHMAVPKLNTFGKNFQMHGYQQPGDKPVNKLEFPEDKNLTLIDQAPVAFLIENQAVGDKAVGNGNNSDNITSPAVFHVFASDTIAPNIGFFGELAAGDGQPVGVGKVSAIFSHLGNQNIFFNVGNLDPVEHGVTEHDLFGRSGYGIQDIGLSSAAIGQGYQLSAQHEGVRFYGLINASVTPATFRASESTTTDSDKPAKKDSDVPVRPLRLQKNKQAKAEDDMREEADPMDRMTGFLWEVGMYNSTNLSATAQNPNPNDFAGRLNMYFSGDSFIGIQGYSGTTTVGPDQASRYRFAGPDLSYYFGKPIEKSKGMMIKPFNLLAGYITGQVDSPNADGMRASWNGYFAELDYALTARSMCFIRYDKVNSNQLANLEPTITDAVTLNYTYYLRTNFWLGLEYTHDMTFNKQNMLGFVFDFAF